MNKFSTGPKMETALRLEWYIRAQTAEGFEKEEDRQKRTINAMRNQVFKILSAYPEDLLQDIIIAWRNITLQETGEKLLHPAIASLGISYGLNGSIKTFVGYFIIAFLVNHFLKFSPLTQKKRKVYNSVLNDFEKSKGVPISSNERLLLASLSDIKAKDSKTTGNDE